MLTPDEFQPESEVAMQARDSFVNLERAAGIVPLLELVKEWWKEPESIPANFARDRHIKNEDKIIEKRDRANAHHFLNVDCMYLMVDWMCSRVVTPCRFSDCNPINATLCSVSYITNYLQCAKQKCREDLDSDCDPDDITMYLMYNVSRAVDDTIYENSALMSGNVVDLLKKIWKVLSFEISQYQQLVAIYDQADCMVEIAGLVDARITTCDPSINNVTISTGATKDGSYVLITTLAILVVVVSASSCSGVNIAKPHNTAIVNAAFGMMTVNMVFVGGLNIDRYAKRSDEPRPDLVIWCCLYYIVSCLVFHHSLFFFLPEERQFHCEFWHLAYVCCRRLCCKKTKDPEKKKNEKKKEKKKCTLAQLSRFRKNLTKISGRYFIIFLWFKKIIMGTQQLIGITNSIDETEAFDAFLTTLLVALNMLLLPFMYHVVLHISGPTYATAVNIFLSTLIRQSYVAFSVFVRRTETAVSGKNFWEALLRHSLTLLPALMFVSRKDKYYQLQKIHTEHSMRQSQIELTQPKTRTNSKRLRRTSLSLAMNSKSHVVTNVMAVIGILIGLSLGIFSTLRFQNIQQECREQLGILADCARPRYYFKNGFFLGTPTCAIEDYVAFDCANGTLIDVDNLFDNSSVYADMIRLERIDVSGNRRLASLPRSWSAVPNDIVVSAAHNPALISVPYALCRKIANITIDVSNTPFAKVVNWSGQISKEVPRNNDFESRNLDVSRSCLNSAQHAHTLDVSNNGLTCGLRHCEFEATILNMRNLSFLDIGHNEIKKIDGSLSSITRNIQVMALEISRFPAINLVGNDIGSFYLYGESAGVLKSWFTTMRALGSVKEGALQADLNATEFRELEIGKLRSLKELLIHGKNTVHEFDFLHESNIEFLFLDSCNIDNTKAEKLASALRQSNLKSLYLYENTFDESGALALVESIEYSNLKKLKILRHRRQFSAGFQKNLSSRTYMNSKGENVTNLFLLCNWIIKKNMGIYLKPHCE